MSAATRAWGWLVVPSGGRWRWVAFGPFGKASGSADSRPEARAAADGALIELRLASWIRGAIRA